MAKNTRLDARWERFAPPGWLARVAREVGFGERNRTLLPSRFFWVLVLAPLIIGERTYAGLARLFSALTGEEVTDSAVFERFSEATAQFMRRAYNGIQRRVWNHVGTELKGLLARFRDISIFDSTVLRLRDFLAKKFPACRTNHTKAAAKMHTIMSLKKGQVKQMLVTAERVSDHKAFEVGPWAEAHLLLFDLGYFSWKLFKTIQEQGGFFVSRLKVNCDGVVEEVRRGLRGPVGSIGRKLSECILQGPGTDITVRFGRGKGAISLRVICVYDKRADENHLFVTNLLAKDFDYEQIGQLYRLRWQVELLFKELKSDLGIDDLRSKREEVILCHIYAALITLLLSRFLRTEAATYSGVDIDDLVPRRVTKAMMALAAILGKAILMEGSRELNLTLEHVLETLAIHALEPNPGRPGAFRRCQKWRA